ncbi:Lpg1974 family pore-forming outer membrane protein [Anatilimnocola sp. NA78]|uniref:Lpg1974 family pore-forming outer membrane protein n=1 Tax=Anatilimnocola sp. NA78 TaxID=3415683 RepID=UPI003CE539CF
MPVVRVFAFVPVFPQATLNWRIPFLIIEPVGRHDIPSEGYAAYMEPTMKCYWRVLFVAFAYLAYAGQAHCAELALEGPSYAAASGWPDGQLSFGYEALPRPGEFLLVSGEADLGTVTGSGLAPAPDQVSQVDLSDYEDCSPVWAHRSGIFGEIMLLRARGVEVAYAVPINGAIVPPPAVPVQVGPTAVADPDYSAGFRIGGTGALDDCTSVSLTYSRFQSSSTDTVGTAAPLVLRSLVFHPGTANAGSDFLDAFANSDVKFDLVDADYRAVWSAGDLWAVNYQFGVRYAGLKQDFTGVYSGTGTIDTLVSNMDFDGGGMRVGMDAMRFAGNSGFLIYGKTSASFVAGEFRGRYTQFSDVDPLIVDTTWKAGRVISILDLELGAGWQSCCGRWRVTGGYMVAGWFNSIPQNQWIQAVQTNDFASLSDTMNAITFDGFNVRLEYRW